MPFTSTAIESFYLGFNSIFFDGVKKYKIHIIQVLIKYIFTVKRKLFIL